MKNATNDEKHSHVRIGRASWSVPAPIREHFPATGTHLERYSHRLNAVEINSSFYRPHKPQTYAKWAASAPTDFRFAVKVPKAITHVCKLQGTTELLVEFLEQVKSLGSKLGPLLVQLPPRHAFNSTVVTDFFRQLRQNYSGDVVCEPRNLTWFTNEVDTLLSQFRIGRVAADPAICHQAALPGGWTGIQYYRLHGSPRIYHSRYDEAFLKNIADAAKGAIAENAGFWCIFDNTASGAAAANALELQRLV